MADPNIASRHVAYEQVKTILDFMGQHVDFATGSLRTLEARHTSKRLWSELTKILNSCRSGTRKTSDGWSKVAYYWSDFKNKLKNKARLLKKKNASKKGIKPLTKLEKRALVILGPDFQKKISHIDTYNSTAEHLPPEIKLEGYQESTCNDNGKTEDPRDTLSGVDRDSDESSESCHEEYVDTDQHSNESLMQSLYPKWLIEIERKRAEAELLRAKAEERRADVAAKTAEAALLQADALRKLAEATSTQADALMRIAIVLENRGHQDDMLSI